MVIIQFTVTGWFKPKELTALQLCCSHSQLVLFKTYFIIFAIVEAENSECKGLGTILCSHSVWDDSLFIGSFYFKISSSIYA